MCRLLCLFIIYCSCYTLGHSQVRIGFQTGSMSYVGDLAPLSSSISFSNPRPYLSFSIGSQINSFLDANLKYTLGSVEGDDFDSKDNSRRLRNLSFRSTIAEYGVSINVDFNRLFLSSLDKYGIRVFYNTGLNFYTFNPKTQFQGEWVYLKPLNTECQGCSELVDYGEYSLNQFNIPFGIGFDFSISGKLRLGFIWTQRLLFTDYLDDVSNVYVDKAILNQKFGPVSAALSDRRYELNGGNPNASTPGAPRGNPNNKDGYFTFGVSLTYFFSPLSIPKASEEAKIEEIKK